MNIGVSWASIANFAIFLGSLTICYVIYRDERRTLIPFISDTGAFQPDSCWFALFFNLSAYSFLFTSCIRYIQIREHLGKYNKAVDVTNKVFLSIGVLSSLGLALVASFPAPALLSVHNAGAAIAFGFSNLYNIFQVGITVVLCVKYKSLIGLRVVLALRVFFTILGLVTLIVHMYSLRKNSWPMAFEPYTDELKRDYYICTTCQWICAISVAIVDLTQVYEFSQIKIELNVTKIEEEETDSYEMSSSNSTAGR